VDRGKIGRGTFETFGKPDPTGYQDKFGKQSPSGTVQTVTTTASESN